MPTLKQNDMKTRRIDTIVKKKDRIEGTSTKIPGLKVIYQML